MIPKLKPGDKVKYKSIHQIICIAQVTKVYADGFFAKLLQIDGEKYDGTDVQAHMFSNWESAQCHILPPRVKLIDHGSYYTTEPVKNE